MLLIFRFALYAWLALACIASSAANTDVSFISSDDMVITNKLTDEIYKFFGIEIFQYSNDSSNDGTRLDECSSEELNQVIDQIAKVHIIAVLAEQILETLATYY